MKTRHPRRTIGNAMLAGALALGSGAALANERDSLWFDEMPGGTGEINARQIEDETLHRFVDAAHAVQTLRREYADRIRRADPSGRVAILAEADELMAQAVEQQGLEVSDYREIGDLLENDEDLRDRLDQGVAASAGS